MGKISVKILEAEERWNITPDELLYMSEDDLKAILDGSDE